MCPRICAYRRGETDTPTGEGRTDLGEQGPLAHAGAGFDHHGRPGEQGGGDLLDLQSAGDEDRLDLPNAQRLLRIDYPRRCVVFAILVSPVLNKVSDYGADLFMVAVVSLTPHQPKLSWLAIAAKVGKRIITLMNSETRRKTEWPPPSKLLDDLARRLFQYSIRRPIFTAQLCCRTLEVLNPRIKDSARNRADWICARSLLHGCLTS